MTPSTASREPAGCSSSSSSGSSCSAVRSRWRRGAIGLAKYLGFFFPVPGRARLELGMRSCRASSGNVAWGQVAAMGVMALVTVLAYRRIAAAGRLMVVLWVGMLVTVAWVIVDRPDPLRRGPAFDFPERAWHVDGRLGVRRWAWRWRSRCTTSWATTRSATWATRSPIRPGRIPRSILISRVVGQPGLPDHERRHPRRPTLARGGRIEARRERPDAATSTARGPPGW